MATNQVTTKQKPYFLSDDERLDVGSQIAEALDKTDALQAEKESFAANHKAKEKDLAQHLDKLRKLHRDGFELRDYKCNIVRNSDTHTVDFVIAEGDKAGEIIDQRPWNQDDWNAHLSESQLGIPFDSAGNPDAPDENDLRAQASLTNEPALTPDVDELGNVVAGADTDAYNMAHKDSPYQHLSEFIDFAPAIAPPAGEQAQDEAAEPTDAADVDPIDLPATLTDEWNGNDSEDNNDEPSGNEPQPDKPTPPKPPKARRIEPKK